MAANPELTTQIVDLITKSDHAMGLMELSWKTGVPSDRLDEIQVSLDALVLQGRVMKTQTCAPFPNFTYRAISVAQRARVASTEPALSR